MSRFYLNLSKSVFTVLLCIGGLSLIYSCDTEKQTQNITQTEAEEFYEYAYPLVMMKISQDAMLTSPLRKNDRLNKFIMFSKLAQPENTAVVLGNRNTLYCVGWIDLSEGPVLFEIPDMGNRYFVMPLIDAWTNTFESFGSRTTGQLAQKYFLTLATYSGETPEGYKRVNCPTSMVWITGRIQSDNDKDALVANQLQSQYVLQSYRSYLGEEDPLDNYSPDIKAIEVKKPVPYSLSMDAEKFYNTFFEMIVNNPAAKADSEFLSKYGFMDTEEKLLFENLDANTQEILKKGISVQQKKYSEIFYAGNEQKSAWDFKIEDMGSWGSNYARRAYYAVWGIGANIPKDAVYGVSQLDGTLKQLEGTNTYKISFAPGDTPDVGGFWSITAYNNEGYLEANAQNRYSSGSNMPLKFNEDGSLDLYLTAAKPNDVDEYNWIPTPEGTFKILFRMYWPKESILNGSYKLPNIEKL